MNENNNMATVINIFFLFVESLLSCHVQYVEWCVTNIRSVYNVV
jgi:hypothetical protein